MLNPGKIGRGFILPGATDMRKSFNGFERSGALEARGRPAVYPNLRESSLLLPSEKIQRTSGVEVQRHSQVNLLSRQEAVMSRACERMKGNIR